MSSSLPTVTFDVFNTSLYGPNSPAFDQREAYLNSPTSSPIPGRDTDMMCLVELDFLNDIQALAAMAGDAGTNSFPYSYYVHTDQTTPFTTSVEQDGATPPPVTQPPCGGNTDMNFVQKAFQCMEQYCDTVPNSSAGTLAGTTDCLSNNCPGPLGALLEVYSQDPVCFDCIVDHVASNQTYSATQSDCVQKKQTQWGFNGQVSQMILSRYPIIAQDSYILPSTNYRQAILFATVQLPQQQVDFYCAFLSSTLVASSVPYTGNYGAGGTPNDPNAGGAYANEQLYQANLLIDWVKKKSVKNPAIITGDWRSGLGPNSDGGAPPPDSGLFQAPNNLVAPTVSALFGAKGFVPATSSGWAATPQCNFCPGNENVLNAGQADGYFVLQPFLYNWGNQANAANATTAEQLLYNEPVVIAGDAQVPPSQYFGLNVSVLRP